MTVIDYAPRPRPGTDRARAEQPPTVDSYVDEREHNVTIQVAGQVDVEAFAKTVHRDAHMRWCWMTLARNSSESGAREIARKDLLANPLIRDALTITLIGGDAERMSLALDEACTTPPDCAFCSNYAITREYDRDVCGAHVEPDALDVYEHNREH